MDIILTEEQYKNLILEYYDKDKVYVRSKIFDSLKGAPGFLWTYAKGLPRFYIRDENGNPLTDNEGKKIVFTKIPEIIYDWIHGNF